MLESVSTCALDASAAAGSPAGCGSGRRSPGAGHQRPQVAAGGQRSDRFDQLRRRGIPLGRVLGQQPIEHGRHRGRHVGPQLAIGGTGSRAWAMSLLTWSWYFGPLKGERPLKSL